MAARCQVCGRRVARVDPGCPLHGPAPSSGGVDAESSQVTAIPRPVVPGYELLCVLGRGGFGTVFAAEREEGGATVAIKVARRDRPDAMPFLAAEIKALSRVGPPYVPAVHGWGKLDDGSLYVVMERIEGPTLADRLVAGAAPMSFAEVAATALGVLEALEGVHAAGYAHGDLKPENVLLGQRGTARLVDLGAAVALSPGSPAKPQADGGDALGTAEYMAPEQCEGRADIDARADIYAMGVILYELIAGRPPFSGPRAAVLQSQRDRRPPPLEASAPIGPGLAAVVLRCLSKDRQERYASVPVLRAALKRALAEQEMAPVDRVSVLPTSGPVSIAPMSAAPPSAPMSSGPVSIAPMSTAPMSAAPPSAPMSSGPVSIAPMSAAPPSAPMSSGPVSIAPMSAAPSSASSSIPAPPGSYPGVDAPASSRTHERRKVGLVFFDAEIDGLAVHQQLLALGGQLAGAVGSRFVAIYGHDVGDNPARRALRAARELVKRGTCKRALVDLASVLVQTRADGTRRFLSPLFSREDRFPTPADPDGLFIMKTAAEVMPDVSGDELPDERGWVQINENRLSDPAQIIDAGRALSIVGRDAMVEALLEGAHRAAEGFAPTLVSIVAEGGYGKSHLARAIVGLLRAIDPRAQVIELRGREPSLGGADTTVRDLLQHVLDLPTVPPHDGGRELLERRLGPSRAPTEGPVIALAMGWISPDAPELKARKAAPSALRSSLMVAAGEALRRRAVTAPVFVMLDDAHYADDATLGALEHATTAEAGAPIWACALGRPSFLAARPSWGERAAFRDAQRLGPLSPEAATALCRELLAPAENVPEPAVRRLVERTQAIPLLLVELVRCLKREGLVRRQPKGGGFYLATDEIDRLPDMPLLDWLAEGELDALAPSLRSHARLIALLGADTSIPEIEGVLRRLDRQSQASDLPLDARVGVSRLLAAGVLVPQPKGRVGFRHELAREATARKVSVGLRLRVHHAAYEYYRDAEALPEERRLLQAAHHAQASGLVETAVEAHLALAERARARHAYLEAERLYSRALEPPGVPSLAAYRGRGLMRYRLGRYHDALDDLARAGEMAARAGDEAMLVEVLLDEATVLDWMDEYKSSEQRVERACHLTPAGASQALEARLLLGLGRSLHRACREDAAAAMLERAAAQAGLLGDEGYETLVVSLLMLGFIYQGLGRLDDAKAALDRAITLCDAHGDGLHLVSAINNRGLLWACLGDKARMVADLSRVVVLGRDLGQAGLELYGEYNLGECLHLMDDREAAAPHVERAVALEARRAGSGGRPVVALLEARFRLYCGEEAMARAIVERVRERQERARAEGKTDQLLVPSEEVLCAMIDLATRDASDAMWDELEARSARCSVGQERVEVLEARAVAAARRGHLADGRRHLDKALAAAARIPNAMSARLRRRQEEFSGGRE